MVFVKLLLTVIITSIVYAFLPNIYVLTLGITFFVGYLLEIVVENIEDNYYLVGAYLVIVSILLTIVCMLIPDSACRMIVWIVTSIGLLSTSALLIRTFADHVYQLELEPYDHEANYENGSYYRHKQNVLSWYNLKWFIFASPILFISLIICVLVKDAPAFGFLFTAVFIIMEAVLLLVMKIKGISPDTRGSKIHSFRDIFIHLGAYFKRKGMQFVNFFKAIGRFFKRLFTGELFKRKPRVKKYKKKKYRHSVYKTSIFSKIGEFFAMIGRGIASFFKAIGRFFKRIFTRRRSYDSYSSRSYRKSYYSSSSLGEYTGMLIIMCASIVLGLLNGFDLITKLANWLPNQLNYINWFYFTVTVFTGGMGVVESILGAVGLLSIILAIPLFLVYLAICLVVGVLELALIIIGTLLAIALTIILAILAFCSIIIVAPGLVILQIIFAVKKSREGASVAGCIWITLVTVAAAAFGIIYNFISNS